MNSKQDTSAITLNYAGKHFTKDNFRCEKTIGAYIPVFVYSESERIARSVYCHVVNTDKTMAGNSKDYFPGVYLPAQCYILVEKGTRGFDIEVKVFNCAAVNKGDEIIVDITESHDENLLKELWKAVNSNRVIGRDRFNESVVNGTIPNDVPEGIRYDVWMKSKLRQIKETRFLDADTEDEIHHYFGLKYLDGKERNYFDVPKQFHTDSKNVQVQMSNGLFAPYQEGCLEDAGGRHLEDTENISALLLKNWPGSEFIILKPVELRHDVNALMWLKAELQYRYPQDADAIARDYPQLYLEVTKKNEPWRKALPLDEAPAPPRFGDKEMLIPCVHMRENLWLMEKGPFQFTCRPEGAFLSAGPEQKYLVCGHREAGHYGVKFINHGGQEFFAVYKSAGLKRYRKDVYGHYRFYDLVPLSKFHVDPGYDFMLKALWWTYHFEVQRNGLISEAVDEETFNDLDVLVSQGDEE